MSPHSPAYGTNVAILCRTRLSVFFFERLSNGDHHVMTLHGGKLVFHVSLHFAAAVHPEPFLLGAVDDHPVFDIPLLVGR